MTLDELYSIIEERKKNPQKDSYVSSLFKDGEDRIIQKVGEEAIEVVIAAKNNNINEIINEVADVWFHSLVLLSSVNIAPEKIAEQLEKRMKQK